jgi:glycosyltransferase involved in cell wall biosynthesis
LIFSFVKYISPIWYFNIKPQQDHCYFPTQETLSKNNVDFDIDLSYETKEGQLRDLAYRAFHSGYIETSNDNTGSDIWQEGEISIIDNYRFIRKYYSKFWCYYIFFMRIVSLHNPFKEINGLLKTRSVQRVRHSNHFIKHTDYIDFNSSLISDKPLVSVIIPTLNRYKYLVDVFKDLENQTYQHFEVIVVDQTDPFIEENYKGWSFDLKFWYQEDKALWKARNEAIQSSKGEYILLYDDDSLVEPDWIEQHLKTIDYFNADISSGVSLRTVGAKVPEHYSYFRWSDQLDTGNALLRKSIFDDIGLFDVKFEKQRMGDGEFGMRAYLAGLRNISNPFAKRVHLKVGQGGLRQMGSWDGWRPKKFFSARPIPSILYYFRKYYGNKAALYSLIKHVPTSILPYKYKGSVTAQMVSYFVSIFIAPILICQVIISWKHASKMLST